MVCPEDRSITKNYVDKILQGGLASPDEDVIYRILGKDGYHWISDTTVKVELPGGTFFAVHHFRRQLLYDRAGAARGGA